jgi:hypothetical protein
MKNLSVIPGVLQMNPALNYEKFIRHPWCLANESRFKRDEKSWLMVV